MEFNRKEIIKFTKSLTDLGVKEDKFTEEVIKKFKVSETEVYNFYKENTNINPFNRKFYFFLIAGLILTFFGVISGTIQIFFGIVLVAFSVTVPLQNIKFNKMCKRLLLKNKLQVE